MAAAGHGLDAQYAFTPGGSLRQGIGGDDEMIDFGAHGSVSLCFKKLQRILQDPISPQSKVFHRGLHQLIGL